MITTISIILAVSSISLHQFYLLKQDCFKITILIALLTEITIMKATVFIAIMKTTVFLKIIIIIIVSEGIMIIIIMPIIAIIIKIQTKRAHYDIIFSLFFLFFPFFPLYFLVCFPIEILLFSTEKRKCSEQRIFKNNYFSYF